MHTLRNTAAALMGLCCALATAQTTVQRVTVFPRGNLVQIEVNASGPVTPQTQIVANPDRLVIDFPNSLPGSDLHDVSINRGQVRGLRVGLFASNPPVTRVVVDLDAPQTYEIFPSGSTIVLKLSADGKQVASASRPALTPVSVHPGAMAATPMNPPAAPIALAPAVPPPPRMLVDYKNGKLKIFSDRATLAEVLTEVRRRTGADIAIPPSASQEQVFGTLGPGPAREVMAALLNGSHFNFVVVSAENDPTQLRSVLLTPRDGAPVSIPAIVNPQPATVDNQPDPNDTAGAPETEPPPVDDNPNPNPDFAADPAAADNDNPQAEPDMAPRRHRRGGTNTAEPPE